MKLDSRNDRFAWYPSNLYKVYEVEMELIRIPVCKDAAEG